VNEHFWFPNGSDDFLKRNTINFLNYALILRRSVFLVFTIFHQVLMISTKIAVSLYLENSLSAAIVEQ
jgi:hypothetical protein